MTYTSDDLITDCLCDIYDKFTEGNISLQSTFYGDVTFEDIMHDLQSFKLYLHCLKDDNKHFLNFSFDVHYYSIIYFIQFISTDFYKSVKFDDECCRFIKILRKSIEFITISNLKEFI